MVFRLIPALVSNEIYRRIYWQVSQDLSGFSWSFTPEKEKYLSCTRPDKAAKIQACDE